MEEKIYLQTDDLLLTNKKWEFGNINHYLYRIIPINSISCIKILSKPYWWKWIIIGFIPFIAIFFLNQSHIGLFSFICIIFLSICTIKALYDRQKKIVIYTNNPKIKIKLKISKLTNFNTILNSMLQSLKDNNIINI